MGLLAQIVSRETILGIQALAGRRCSIWVDAMQHGMALAPQFQALRYALHVSLNLTGVAVRFRIFAVYSVGLARLSQRKAQYVTLFV